MSYFTWTGNPWVDAGTSALMQLSKKNVPEEINLKNVQQSRDMLLTLFLSDGWKKNLFSIFPNGAVTNPAVKNKKSHLTDDLDDLLSHFQSLGTSGDCIACGRRTTRNGKNRTHIPLTGYAGSHFFSFTANGADYCDCCTFAIQCIPLVLYRCGNLALIHSNSERVLAYWARRCLKDVRMQLAKKKFTGCFNEDYKNPMNALFHITQDLILSYDERWASENAAIRIYHFTNYNQGADLDIYDLPTHVFRFLSSVRKHDSFHDWMKVVQKGYRYNIKNKAEEEYRNYPNEVYHRLLNGGSILRYFVDYSRKLALGNWDLLSLYLKEVLSMDQVRIDTIRRVADEVTEVITTLANGKKRLNALERADNYGWFRNVLLRLTKDRIAAGKEQPLFSYDEYVERFFPDGALGWKETQDLILFRVYEKLHKWLMKEGLVVEEEEGLEAVKDEK